MINTQTNQTVGSAIGVGTEPVGVAITPNGQLAYVTNNITDNVSVINTQTNQTVGSAITVGSGPEGIAITPNGQRAYVANENSNNVSVINTATNTAGSSINVGMEPTGIAIVPDQPPVASFKAKGGRAVRLNGSASRDPDGSVARYDWAFGDGQTALNAGPTPSHSYRASGRYRVNLIVKDNEGCSTALIFTGQTASCNGSPAASQTQNLIVVRFKCPKSAKPRGCKLTVEGVTKKRKGKAETHIAKANVKGGKSTLLLLSAKPAFAAKLATATRLLLKETVTIHGFARTRFHTLKLAP